MPSEACQPIDQQPVSMRTLPIPSEMSSSINQLVMPDYIPLNSQEVPTIQLERILQPRKYQPTILIKAPTENPVRKISKRNHINLNPLNMILTIQHSNHQSFHAPIVIKPWIPRSHSTEMLPQVTLQTPFSVMSVTRNSTEMTVFYHIILDSIQTVVCLHILQKRTLRHLKRSTNGSS